MSDHTVDQKSIPLDPDIFFRSLIRRLAGTFEGIFGEKVLGRPSMCMMTSNVFGAIAADNLGFAKIELRETIATGKQGCIVVVHLKSTPETNAVEGREYVES